MKKKINKNKKAKALSKPKKLNVLMVAKKTAKRKKIVVAAKKAKAASTKSSAKSTKKAILIKKVKIRNSKKGSASILTLGNIQPQRGRILFLTLAIVFIITGMTVFNLTEKEKETVYVPVAVSNRNVKLEREINNLVEGYPIAKMTAYIADKDPQVAAFMIAIAKKESAWGKRKPVLDGQDCYNYWGFRLKAEKMGSGGHTCFDSPKEAVDAVAARIGEMVKEEKIDSPKKMIVWKCGYGCQNQNKTVSEQKWISDVGFYYDKLSNYL